MHYSESSRPVEWLKANYTLLESLCDRSTEHLCALLFVHILQLYSCMCARLLYWPHLLPLNPEIENLKSAQKKLIMCCKFGIMTAREFLSSTGHGT